MKPNAATNAMKNFFQFIIFFPLKFAESPHARSLHRKMGLQCRSQIWGKGERLPLAGCLIKSEIESLASPRKLSGLRCSFAPLRMIATLAKGEKSAIANRQSVDSLASRSLAISGWPVYFAASRSAQFTHLPPSETRIGSSSIMN